MNLIRPCLTLVASFGLVHFSWINPAHSQSPRWTVEDLGVGIFRTCARINKQNHTIIETVSSLSDYETAGYPCGPISGAVQVLNDLPNSETRGRVYCFGLVQGHPVVRYPDYSSACRNTKTRSASGAGASGQGSGSGFVDSNTWTFEAGVVTYMPPEGASHCIPEEEIIGGSIRGSDLVVASADMMPRTADAVHLPICEQLAPVNQARIENETGQSLELWCEEDKKSLMMSLVFDTYSNEAFNYLVSSILPNPEMEFQVQVDDQDSFGDGLTWHQEAKPKTITTELESSIGEDELSSKMLKSLKSGRNTKISFKMETVDGIPGLNYKNEITFGLRGSNKSISALMEKCLK